VGGTDVCTYDTSTDTWTCDINIGTGGNPSAAVVADHKVVGSTYCNTGVDYAAWGTTRGGTNFYCSRDSTSTDTIPETHETAEATRGPGSATNATPPDRGAKPYPSSAYTCPA
jgi:hypothetical protein